MQELLFHKGLLYDLYTITLGPQEPKTTEIAALIAGAGKTDNGSLGME
jgi:hypothetical protein